jgi:hypothetical protein
MDKDLYIGKTVIVGISYYDENDKYLDQKQFHGKIIDADPEKGIRYVDEIKKEIQVLPPRADALFPAPLGTYREYSTGEFIKNPDFISQWRVKKKTGDNDEWEWTPYRTDFRIRENAKK